MSASDGHGGRSAGVVAASARPVVLVRYRPGVVGQTARMVHVVVLPTVEHAGAVKALCGAVLLLSDIETVAPGEGMPCTVCVLDHLTRTIPTGKLSTGGFNTAGAAEWAASGACYQRWGWPVRLHRDQVRLSLHRDRDVSAVAIPLSLCTRVVAVLTRRWCAPPVLAHPYAPEHRIVLTGERYGVRLPWPAPVHEITGALLLPPTVTPRGPITWARAPREDSLLLCREIDLFGAVRTALSDSASGVLPPGGGEAL